jgi:hypothetical protein
MLIVAGATLAAVWAADRKQKPANHPEQAPSERVQKSELTTAVSKRLPPTAPIPVQRRNYIDTFIFDAMERDKIPHAPLSTDQEFIRRVSLDLTGRIPDSAAIRKFLADKDPEKRDKLIASIVEPERYQFQEEDAFVDRWTYWFNDLF